MLDLNILYPNNQKNRIFLDDWKKITWKSGPCFITPINKFSSDIILVNISSFTTDISNL